jgi:hypothetical protein
MTHGGRLLKESLVTVRVNDPILGTRLVSAHAILALLGVTPIVTHTAVCRSPLAGTRALCWGEEACDASWPAWVPDSIFDHAFALADEAASAREATSVAAAP